MCSTSRCHFLVTILVRKNRQRISKEINRQFLQKKLGRLLFHISMIRAVSITIRKPTVVKAIALQNVPILALPKIPADDKMQKSSQSRGQN